MQQLTGIPRYRMSTGGESLNSIVNVVYEIVRKMAKMSHLGCAQLI